MSILIAITNKNMMNCNCKWGGCILSKVGTALVVIGGINWGLVGVGMLMGKMMDWNLVNMILGSVSSLEAVVYVLVGVAAVMKIFGCRCKKCMASCADCSSCQVGGAEQKM